VTRRAALARSLGAIALRPFAKAQTVARSLVEGLRASLKGQLIVPGDPNYEQARRPISFNPTTDKHPQMIVRCLTREDVARAVVFARERRLDVTPLIRTPGQVTYFFNASWADPNLGEPYMRWVDRSWTAMRSFSSDGAYINYLSVDNQTAIKASYGKSYDRLVDIKRRYDTSNFFHRNRNIRS
jgi:hypothetical protein